MFQARMFSDPTVDIGIAIQATLTLIVAGTLAGFRSPTLQQMYAVSESRGQITVGDPGLDPEKSNFYNLNIEYNHRLFSIAAPFFTRPTIAY